MIKLINTMSRLDVAEYCEMSHQEIADALFLNVKTVSATERRAIAKIKAIFEKHGITSQNLLVD